MRACQGPPYRLRFQASWVYFWRTRSSTRCRSAVVHSVSTRFQPVCSVKARWMPPQISATVNRRPVSSWMPSKLGVAGRAAYIRQSGETGVGMAQAFGLKVAKTQGRLGPAVEAQRCHARGCGFQEDFVGGHVMRAIGDRVGEETTGAGKQGHDLDGQHN